MAFEQFEKIVGRLTDRIKNAMINPELDRVKAESKKALEALKKTPGSENIAVMLLESGLKGLRVDLAELKVSEDQWKEYEKVYKARFEMATKGLEKEAIFTSMEADKLTLFVDDYAKYTRLDEVIKQCKGRESGDPLKKFIRLIQNNSSLLSGLGAGLMAWLNAGKEEGAKPTAPNSNLDKKAAEADKALDQGSSTTASASTGPETSTGAPGESETKAPAPPKRNNKVESESGAHYEPIPRGTEALSGSEFLKKYETEPNAKKRHMMVLEQLALGNVPDHFKTFETLKITSEKGTVVEMEVARHNLRIGTDDDYAEFPLDGPHAMAAAEMYGCTLSTPWISDRIHDHAKASGGHIDFIAAPAIAKELGIENWDKDHPDGEKMMSPEFVKKRNEMLRAHKSKNDQITSGSSKEVVHPIPGRTKSGRLEIYGGYRTPSERVQPISGGIHPKPYFDYSHGIRLVRTKLKVNGEAMSLSDFTNNAKYADEFGFEQMPIGRAYAYSSELETFVSQHKPTAG